MNAHEAVRIFAQRIGLSALRLNDRGLARVELQPGVAIDFELDSTSDYLYVYHVLSRSLEGKNVATRLLIENYRIHRKLSGGFGFDPHSGEYVYSLRFLARSIDYDEWESSLNALAELALKWTKFSEVREQSEGHTSIETSAYLRI